MWDDRPMNHDRDVSTFVTNDRDQAEGQLVATLLEELQALVDGSERVLQRSPAKGSELAVDDGASGFIQLSHLARTVLTVAADDLRGAFRLMTRDGDLYIPLQAHYPVLRAALENSAIAKWILLPDDARERRKRNLRARWSELLEDDKLHAATAQAASRSGVEPEGLAAGVAFRDKQRELVVATMKGLASADGLEWGHIASGMPGWGRVIRESTETPESPGETGESVWKILSGLSHPSVARSTQFASVTELSESDGMRKVRMSASTGWTIRALGLALETFASAVDLYRLRLLKPATRAN